jgi:coenzyme F420-reducing hydrogenase beta subunit
MVTQQFYATRCKDNDLLLRSSSGGIFGVLASSVLAKGGIVYGAAFFPDFSVIHKRCKDIEELSQIYGSKYVQSSIESVYETIGSDLASGMVLFSGTPCQVAAIKNFVKAKHLCEKNLVLCDVLCHGVPSPLIWQDYLGIVQKKIGKLIHINFRNKNPNWARYSVLFEGSRKKYQSNHSNNSYMRLFVNSYILRDACYQCSFATRDRVGDITLGDYWGIQRAHPDFYDEKGVSLCMVNTQKGKELFQANALVLDILETTFEKCAQPVCNNQPSRKPKRYQEFWNQYTKYGLEKAIRVMPSLTVRRFKGRFVRLIVMVLKKLGLLEFVKRMVGRQS